MKYLYSVLAAIALLGSGNVFAGKPLSTCEGVQLAGAYNVIPTNKEYKPIKVGFINFPVPHAFAFGELTEVTDFKNCVGRVMKGQDEKYYCIKPSVTLTNRKITAAFLNVYDLGCSITWCDPDSYSCHSSSLVLEGTTEDEILLGGDRETEVLAVLKKIKK